MEITGQQVAVEALGLGIILWAFAKFLVGPILGHLDERAAKVRADYDAAESRRTEMEALKATYEERMSKVEEEVREHLTAAAARGETLVAEMEAKAADASAKTLARVEREITEMRERLRKELRAETARLVIAVSERFLTKRMAGEDEALVERLLKEVSASLEA